MWSLLLAFDQQRDKSATSVSDNVGETLIGTHGTWRIVGKHKANVTPYFLVCERPMRET